MNKYQDALNLLRTWAKKDRDAYSPKHLENINNFANTLQELVDFNKTFMHVLGSIDFKALRNILETKLPKKPTKKSTANIPTLNIDITFGKCPTCGSVLVDKQNYCTKCGQAIDWGVEND
jgi:hypothetical protein